MSIKPRKFNSYFMVDNNNIHNTTPQSTVAMVECIWNGMEIV